MEPNEFDRIIQERVSASKAHQSELEDAQPYVWSAIQQELHQPKKNNKWFYLAAASIILMIGFGSAILYSFQIQHKNELAALKNQLKEMNQLQNSQYKAITSKELDVAQLQAELNALRVELEEKKTIKEVVSVSPQIVRVRDTVFLERIETMVDRKSGVEDGFEIPVKNEEIIDEPRESKTGIDNGIIYPSYTEKKNRPKNEQGLVVKLSNFSLN